MYSWKPKKKYNNEYNDIDVIIYYVKSINNKYYQKGIIKNIYESSIVINFDTININHTTSYKYTSSCTSCFNIIKNIMVKDNNNTKNIKKALIQSLTRIPNHIVDIIIEFEGRYTEI